MHKSPCIEGHEQQVQETREAGLTLSVMLYLDGPRLDGT